MDRSSFILQQSWITLAVLHENQNLPYTVSNSICGRVQIPHYVFMAWQFFLWVEKNTKIKKYNEHLFIFALEHYNVSVMQNQIA